MSISLALACGLLLQTSFIHEPISSYELRQSEGFSIYVSKAAREHPETTVPALKLMDEQLKQVVRAVPKEALTTLRKIPVFIEHNNPGFPCACYHPSPEWLKQHGYIAEKAKSVEISNTKNFVDWVRKSQPSMVLHELAHGYHELKFGYGDRYIAACHRLAVARGDYEKVAYVNGSTQRHYALNNPMEYFAEMTEAYFGKNDFYPFVRSELRTFDPKGYEMIERLWGVSDTNR